MKSSQEILAELVAEFIAHPQHARLMDVRQAAERGRAKFLADYPVRDQPATVISVIKTSRDAEDFVRRLASDPILWLGAIALRSNRPIEEAGRNLSRFRELLARAVDPAIPIWKRIDGQWDIAGFGGENRQIAKKIVNTYYPELILPVFNTEHAEHFARYLRVEKDFVSNQLYGRCYAALRAPGEIWHVLCEALSRERDQNSHLAGEDNLYFMYCLYRTSACPSNFKPRVA